METKFWLQSKQVWGNIILVIVGILKLIGYDVTVEDFAPYVDALLIVIGGVLTIRGMFSANRKPLRLNP